MGDSYLSISWWNFFAVNVMLFAGLIVVWFVSQALGRAASQ